MIDAVWLLWNRALFDYTKTAAIWLQTRSRGDGTSDYAEKTMNTDVIEHKPNCVARRIACGITGLVLALVIAPLFAFGVYTVITSLMSL
jgi:hypothetical protein